MLFLASIYTTTATHVELTDNVNLTSRKNAQVTHISLRNSNTTSDLSQGLRHAFFSLKVRGEKVLSGYPGTVSFLVNPIDLSSSKGVILYSENNQCHSRKRFLFDIGFAMSRC